MTEAANSRKYLKRIAWGLALVAAVAIAAFAWKRASAPAVASVVEYAMLDPAIRSKIKAVFTCGTPNQGSAFAEWAYTDPVGIDLTTQLGLQNDGLNDIRPGNVQNLRAQLDPILRTAGIPFFALAGDDFLIGGDPILIVTGPILQNLTGEKNDGLVTVKETKLDPTFATNMGTASSNHFRMGWGDYTFAFIRGRIDGFEHAISGFQKIKTGGFGDQEIRDLVAYIRTLGTPAPPKAQAAAILN